MMVKKKNSCKLFLGLAMLSPLMLTACGGSSDSDSSDQGNFTQVSEDIVISAKDITTAVYENTSNEVSLMSAVSISDDSSPKLADVKSVTDDTQCETVSVNPDDVSFVVDTENAGLCVYEYTVSDENGDVTENAYVQMSVTGADAPLVSSGNFEPLSAVAELGGDAVEIPLTRPDMNDSDGNPITFTLSSNVTVMGSGSAVTNAGSTQDTLTYTPGSNDGDEGVTRVFYSYTTPDGIILAGTVDIAVSTNILNRAPTADDWVYIEFEELDNGQAYSPLLEGQKVEVDLANVLKSIDSSTRSAEYYSLVSDSDNPTTPYDPTATDNEDTLYLSEVRVEDAQVCLGPDPSGAEEDSCNDNVTSATELNNLTFRFRASSVGNYYVTYIVSDGNGGYGVGKIGFKVEGTWPNVIITDTKDVFAAPLSLQAATAGDYQISGVASEESAPNGNGTDNVPTYTWSDAYAICLARGGSLPTREQWDDFYAQEGNAFNGTNDLGWPIARNYFTLDTDDDDSNLVYVYNPVTGSTSELVESGIDNGPVTYLGYLACIDKTPVTLRIQNSFLVLRREVQLEAAFQTLGGNWFTYDSPLVWSYSEAEENAAEAMPDIDTNVALDETTGIVITTNVGYVKYTATTPTGALSTSKELSTLKNMLEPDPDDPDAEEAETDGTFDTGSEDYGYCEEELLDPSDTIHPVSNYRNVGNAITMPDGFTIFVGKNFNGTNANYPLSAKVYNCGYDFKAGNNSFYRIQSGYTYNTAYPYEQTRLGYTYEVVSNGGAVDDGDKVFEVAEDGTYVFSLWLYWSEEAIETNKSRVSFSINKKGTGKTIEAISVFPAYGTGTNQSVPVLERADGWKLYQIEYDIDQGSYGFRINHFRYSSTNKRSVAVYVDDIVLTPKDAY